MFIYIYIYIYTYCKLDHLSPFMLLMINICRPDLLNCFWIMPREKNLSKWKWLHLARYTTSSFAHSTILPHSIATIAGIGRPMGCHKQTTNAKNRGHAREVSSILIGSGCFMWDIHRYPATKTGHLFYFASRPWKQYELKQAVFLEILLWFELLHAGNIDWVLAKWFCQVSFLLLNSPGEMICDYSTSRSVLAIVY